MEEKKHLKVLLIEDNEGDIRLIWEILSEIRSLPFYLEVANTLFTGLQAIEKVKPDIILLDLSLPDSNGIYTLNRVKDKALNIPIVIITGLDDELTAIKALKEGAQDYLVKGRMDSDLLKKSLLYAYERNKLLIQIKENQEILNKNFKKLEWLDKAKSNFILNIAEGITKPIIEIKEATVFLEQSKKGKCTPIQKRKLKKIKENADVIYNLINDLLDTIRLETGIMKLNKKNVNIIDILKKTIVNNKKRIQLKRKIKIITDFVKKDVFTEADDYRIQKAFNILLYNLISFANKDKKIFIGNKQDKAIYFKILSSKLNKKMIENILNYNYYEKTSENEEYKTEILNFLISLSIFKAHKWNFKIEKNNEEVLFTIEI